MCQCLSMRRWKYLGYLSLLEPTRAWRLSSETANVMYSWCMTYEWCIVSSLQECPWICANSFLEIMPRTTMTSLLEATINYDTSDFSEHQSICQTRLLAIHAAWVRFVATAALWMSFLRMHLVRTKQGTEARYLLALTWTSFWPLCFSKVYTYFSSSRSFRDGGCGNLPNIWTTSSYWDLLGFVLVW